MTSKRDAILAALSLVENLDTGKIKPAELDAELVSACRALFGQVVGDGDALWSLHTDVCRQAIALGALTADELSEWVAVLRQRQRAGEPFSGPTLPDGTGEPDSSGSGPHSPEIAASEPLPEPEDDT
ncbi:hypothetical protein BST27_29690 [Mycobacterium intermedium]|uniref:Flagellar hook-length control protein n=1 Tax=Mycobacterium intermedium TaxID=28445 RepID=A0A1E3SDY1_MYCIE|nr:hypothetical protein [Mycobacterium intermedium]MCV6965983.1 flagellar hook-length control protein [Mycobacterium intermedium]ODR00341.1 hypothetical protein BHQ20_13360 [Mycobacterium intermedium]OPE51047.1 hypothetical protein BV508_07725 [Mycobacterium intermedium]ORA90512.1 hypothetical protein BST27_29690 [Mycobacterium intermedium]